MTEVISGVRMFPDNNIWNTPITTMPVHASSASYISTMGITLTFRAKVSNTSTGWSIPYNLVTNATPKYPVTFFYPLESDPGPYPIPANPLIEEPLIPGSDRHLLSLNTDTGVAWELDGAVDNGNGTWNATSGAIFDLSSNTLRPDNTTSADGAGLPMTVGLLRYDEVLSGTITHALRFAAPQAGSGSHVWPARHTAGTLAGAAPYGSRFRLKASVDISGYSTTNQTILTALKTYGMFLADQGVGSSIFQLYGPPDDRWDSTDIGALYGPLHLSDFEVVNESSLMVDPNSAAIAQGAYANYKTFIEPGLVAALSKKNLLGTVTLLGPDVTESLLSYTATVLADNPIRYYRLNEASGTVATDLGSQAHNGTYSGSGVTYSQPSPIFGDASAASVIVDGVTGDVSLPTTSLPTGSSAFTIEAWLRVASLPAAGHYPKALSLGSASHDASISFDGDTGQWYFEFDDGGAAVFTLAAIASGVWYYLAGTYDGTTATLYLNGVKQNAANYTASLTYGSAYIALDVTGTVHFSVQVSEVALYSTALTSTQVSAHYTHSNASTNINWLTSASADLKSILGGYARHGFPSGASDISNGSQEASVRSLITSIYANDPTNKPVITTEAGDGSMGPGAGVTQFQYGVEMTDYCVQLLRAGTAGVIGYLADDEMHGTMWGLWDILAVPNTPRPWFFPWSLLCNILAEGSTIYAPTQPAANDFRILAARSPQGSWSFVLVNRAAQARRATLSVPFAPVATITLEQYIYAPGAPLVVDGNGFPQPSGTITTVLSRGFTVPVAAQSVLILTQPQVIVTSIFDVKRPPLQKRR